MPGRSLAVLLIVAACIGLVVFFFPTRPDNAVEAMAAGQYSAAADYYAKSASKGDARASNSLANLYYLGLGVDQDYKEASQLYFEAARAGIAEAQVNLGHLYKLGLGVESEPMRAFAWYNMANIHGSPAAELYMKQITQEWTLSPLQINTALSKWSKLDLLINEGL